MSVMTTPAADATFAYYVAFGTIKGKIQHAAKFVMTDAYVRTTKQSTKNTDFAYNPQVLGSLANVVTKMSRTFPNARLVSLDDVDFAECVFVPLHARADAPVAAVVAADDDVLTSTTDASVIDDAPAPTPAPKNRKRNATNAGVVDALLASLVPVVPSPENTQRVA